MKVFKFYYDGESYNVASPTFEEAELFYNEEINPECGYESFEEIPSEKWHEKTITIFEDNDHSSEPFMISINDAIYDNHAHLISTTDTSII